MIRAFAVVAILVAYAPRTDACSCAPPPPACEAYQSAPIVFVGKATSIVTGAGGSQDVTFVVTEKLKGDVDAEALVEGGGMCGAVFQKGKTYIVYAAGGARLSASLCGRTATIDKAREDLAYARTFHKRTNAVVEGRVIVGDDSRAPRAGVEVRARGTKHRARTDRTGRYKLELPPGNYTLEVVDPKTVASQETVTLGDKHGCEARELVVMWNGRVRGRIVGPDGKPAANVQATLVATGATRAGNQFATTDHAGNYEFTGVQAGEYNVVVYSAKTVGTTTTSHAIKLSQAGTVKVDVKLLP